jgi:hypothetical protein
VYTNLGAGADTSDIGWAVGAGLRWNVPSLGQGDYLIAQVVYGEGAMNYVGSNFGAGGVAMLLTDGFPAVTNAAVGIVFDGVATGGTNVELTRGWSVTGGYEHRWNPQWKTSIYGAYGEIDYNNTVQAFIGGADLDWSLWQVGSRTVWTPVANLDLSLEVLYTNLNKSSLSNVAPVFDSRGYVSGIFRAQRNFWP